MSGHAIRAPRLSYGFFAQHQIEDLTPGQAARLLVRSEAGWGRATYDICLRRLVTHYRAVANDPEIVHHGLIAGFRAGQRLAPNSRRMRAARHDDEPVLSRDFGDFATQEFQFFTRVANVKMNIGYHFELRLKHLSHGLTAG